MYRKRATECVSRLFPNISNEMQSQFVQHELKRAMKPRAQRTPNSFNLFVKDEMPKLRENENYLDLSHKERMQMLSLMWHSAPISTRMKYKTMADAIKLNFHVPNEVPVEVPNEVPVEVPIEVPNEVPNEVPPREQNASQEEDVVLSIHGNRNRNIFRDDDHLPNNISEEDIQVVMRQMNVNRYDAIELIKQYDGF